MKRTLYPALLATAFMPFAAFAQDTGTLPSQMQGSTNQEETSAAAGDAELSLTDDATVTTVPADGSTDMTGENAGSAPGAKAMDSPAGTTTSDTADRVTTSGATDSGAAVSSTTIDTARDADEKAQSSTIKGPFVTLPLSGAWRASDLEGKDVHDANGENIGDISDVLVDEEGKVIAVLVGVGGFLGIGQKDVAVAMQALEFGPGSMEGLPKATDAAAEGTPMGAVRTGGAAGMVDPAAGGGLPRAPDAGIADVPAEGAAAADRPPVVGEDNLPSRIVLNVTREELENAPAYEDVRAGAANGAGGIAPVSGAESVAGTPAAVQ